MIITYAVFNVNRCLKLTTSMIYEIIEINPWTAMLLDINPLLVFSNLILCSLALILVPKFLRRLAMAMGGDVGIGEISASVFTATYAFMSIYNFVNDFTIFINVYSQNPSFSSLFSTP